MRIKTLVALYFWILEFDDVTCIRSIGTCTGQQIDRVTRISINLINHLAFRQTQTISKCLHTNINLHVHVNVYFYL